MKWLQLVILLRSCFVQLQEGVKHAEGKNERVCQRVGLRHGAFCHGIFGQVRLFYVFRLFLSGRSTKEQRKQTEKEKRRYVLYDVYLCVMH